MGTLTTPSAMLPCVLGVSLITLVSSLQIKSKGNIGIEKLPLETLKELKTLAATEVSKIKIRPKDLLNAPYITFPNGDTLIRHGLPTSLPDGFVNVDFMDSRDGEADLTVNIDSGTVEGSLFAANGAYYLIKHVGKLGISQLWVSVPPVPMNGKNDAMLAPPQDRYLEKSVWSKEEEDRLLARALEDDSTIANISIKVYYTKEYQMATPDIDGTLDRVFSVANQGFENSGIKIHLIKHCSELYHGKEIYGGQKMLQRFIRYKPTMLLGSADMAILMTSASNFVGYAYVGTTKWPFGTVTKRASEEGFAFGHEVGHILGGSHDRLQLIKNRARPFVKYGRGYLIPGTDKATVLAYPTNVHSRHINYFSGPEVIDAEGDATGTFGANNVRIINNRRFLYPGIGDESWGCEENLSLKKSPGSCSTTNQGNES